MTNLEQNFTDLNFELSNYQDNVLRSIEAILPNLEQNFTDLNFELSHYSTDLGQSQRELPLLWTLQKKTLATSILSSLIIVMHKVKIYLIFLQAVET